MKHSLFLLLSYSLLFIFPNNTQAQKKIPPEKPKLIIGIVVEQMRYDYIYRFWDKFSEKGFKRLVNEGSFCKNTNYQHLLTQSSPGYATIVTGTSPSQHGIIANNWYLRLQDQMTFCITNSKNKAIGSTAIKEQQKSPAYLIGSTLGDELRLSNFKQSKVIGISLKDYAAILSAGQIGNAAYWLDDQTGNWISTSNYISSLPAWVTEFNNKKLADLYLSKVWNTLLPINKYTESLADNNSYELGFENNENTFPYDFAELRKKNNNFHILRYSPYGNTYTTDFAISTIVNETLGQDDYTDFLTIGYASPGYITDWFGSRSIELEDLYLRLDKEIEHLLNFIDDYIGKKNVLIYLTSDKGVADSPDFLKSIGMQAGYFNAQSSVSLLRSYLNAIYGRANWIRNYSDQQIYLNQVLIDESKISLDDIQLKSAQFLTQFSAINTAITGNTLQTTNFTHGILQKFQNSYNQERSGDILISLKPGWTELKSSIERKIIQTNSPYSYDTHVPLIWYGWKMKRISISKPIAPCDIAPTIANFLQIPFPSSHSGQPILELTE